MELTLFTKLLIILGAVVLSCAAMYFLMRLFCFCEGRKW